MTYSLQNSESHFATLQSALTGCCEEPYDICFISRDGDEVLSHQALLNLHSPLLDEILDRVKDDCPKVSVDASSNTIQTLLQLLLNGEATTDDNNDQVYSVASSLGINMDDLVLESSDKSKVVGNLPVENRKASVGNDSTTTLEEDNEDYNNYKNTVKFNNITLARTGVTKSRNDIELSEFNEHADIQDETDVMNEEINSIQIKEEHLDDTKVVPGPEVECSVCTKSFKTKRYLKRHMEERCKGKVDESFNFKIKGLKCDECGREFTLNQSLKRHKLKNLCKQHSYSPLKCDECGREFSLNQSLKRHKLRNLCKQSYSPLIKIKGKKCDDCGKEFTLNQSLQRHVRRNLCKGKKDQSLTTFKCDKCEKTFDRKQSLQIHQVTHTGDLPYICKECGRSFAWTGQLRKHAKSQHNIKLSVAIKCDFSVNSENRGNEALSDGEPNVVNEEKKCITAMTGLNEEAVYPVVSLFCENFESIADQET